MGGCMCCLKPKLQSGSKTAPLRASTHVKNLPNFPNIFREVKIIDQDTSKKSLNNKENPQTISQTASKSIIPKSVSERNISSSLVEFRQGDFILLNSNNIQQKVPQLSVPEFSSIVQRRQHLASSLRVIEKKDRPPLLRSAGISDRKLVSKPKLKATPPSDSELKKMPRAKIISPKKKAKKDKEKEKAGLAKEKKDQKHVRFKTGDEHKTEKTKEKEKENA